VPLPPPTPSPAPLDPAAPTAPPTDVAALPSDPAPTDAPPSQPQASRAAVLASSERTEAPQAGDAPAGGRQGVDTTTLVASIGAVLLVILLASIAVFVWRKRVSSRKKKSVEARQGIEPRQTGPEFDRGFGPTWRPRAVPHEVTNLSDLWRTEMRGPGMGGHQGGGAYGTRVYVPLDSSGGRIARASQPSVWSEGEVAAAGPPHVVDAHARHAYGAPMESWESHPAADDPRGLASSFEGYNVRRSSSLPPRLQNVLFSFMTTT
jgi:hypothetical protein